MCMEACQQLEGHVHRAVFVRLCVGLQEDGPQPPEDDEEEAAGVTAAPTGERCELSLRRAGSLAGMLVQ